jgi:hypothetical protein
LLNQRQRAARTHANPPPAKLFNYKISPARCRVVPESARSRFGLALAPDWTGRPGFADTPNPGSLPPRAPLKPRFPLGCAVAAVSEARSIVLLGDQVPTPRQQSLRCNNGGDLGQHLSSQHLGLNSQSPALMVIEAQSPIAELLAKHSVLLARVVNDLQLALIHPSGNGDQQKAE